MAQNQDTLQFTSGIKLIKSNSGTGEELWVNTNRFQKLALGTIDVTQVNYRVLLERDVRRLIKGTTCQTW